MTKVMASVLLLFTLALPDHSVANETQCRTDPDCAGESICVSGACKTPRLRDLFPAKSTPDPDQNRYVIKLTPSQCSERKGQFQQRAGTDSSGYVRCLLPRGETPSTPSPAMPRKPE